MGWGTITITFDPTGYTQNYKRDNVQTHPQLRAMIADAVTDSVNKIRANGYTEPIVVDRIHDQQNLDYDPGDNYRLI